MLTLFQFESDDNIFTRIFSIFGLTLKKMLQLWGKAPVSSALVHIIIIIVLRIKKHAKCSILYIYIKKRKSWRTKKRESLQVNSRLYGAAMERTWARSPSDLFRAVKSPSGQRWSPGQLWAGHRLHCLYIKKSRAVWAVCFVCKPLIKHNDVIFRKLKALGDFCNIFKVSSNSFQALKKLKSVVGYIGPRHFSTYS